MMHLPEPTAKPCNECPWRRNSLPGHLGPFTAEQWARLVHSDEAIACHKTIVEEDDWEAPGVRQCAGAGIHRTNVLKKPRDPAVYRSDEPDTESVFAWTSEFVAHHERNGDE